MTAITSATTLLAVLYSISCMFYYILSCAQDELKSNRIKAAICLQFVCDFSSTLLLCFQDQHFAKNMHSHIERLNVAAS